MVWVFAETESMGDWWVRRLDLARDEVRVLSPASAAPLGLRFELGDRVVRVGWLGWPREAELERLVALSPAPMEIERVWQA